MPFAILNTLVPRTKNVTNIRLHGGYIHPCDALRTHFAVLVPCCWAMESGSKHPDAKKYKPKNKSNKIKIHAQRSLFIYNPKLNKTLYMALGESRFPP
jgi:hypothetical protein